jgi:Cu2+-containing amine oxidase
VNRGLKRFFSLYRPLHLIDAYVWPEKYWLVWAGPLANHPFNFNFIFLSDGATAAAERATTIQTFYSILKIMIIQYYGTMLRYNWHSERP